VTFADDGKRLDIIVNYDASRHSVCPRCGAQGVTCKAALETWYHHDFFRYSTYLHTRVPQIACCGRIHTVERPWARTGSKFVQINTEPSAER
jgi:transposase